MDFDLTTLDEQHSSYEEEDYILLRSGNFGYKKTFKDRKKVAVIPNDIIIKRLWGGEEWNYRVHQRHYYQIVVNGEECKAQETSIYSVINLLQKSFIQFTQYFGKVPFLCKSSEMAEDTGNITYEINEFNYFRFNISKKDFSCSSLREYFQLLKIINTNPLEDDDFKNIIFPMDNAAISAPIPIPKTGNKEEFTKANLPPTLKTISDQASGSFCVFGAKMLGVYEQVTTFQENINISYILKLVGGEGAVDDKKKTPHTPVTDSTHYYARASQNAMETEGFKAGDLLTFKGKVKFTREFGDVIQGIRKFTVIHEGASNDETETTEKPTKSKKSKKSTNKKDKIPEPTTPKSFPKTAFDNVDTKPFRVPEMIAPDEYIVLGLTPKIPKKPGYDIYDSTRYFTDRRKVVTHLRPGKVSLRKIDQYLHVLPKLKGLRKFDYSEWPYPVVPDLPENIEESYIRMTLHEYRQLDEKGKLPVNIQDLGNFTPIIPPRFPNLIKMTFVSTPFNETNNLNVFMPELEELVINYCEIHDWKFLPQQCPKLKKLHLAELSCEPQHLVGFPELKEVHLRFTKEITEIPMVILMLPDSLEKFTLEGHFSQEETTIARKSFKEIREYLQKKSKVDWRDDDIVPEDLTGF